MFEKVKDILGFVDNNHPRMPTISAGML